MDLTKIAFSQQVRTASSEVWLVDLSRGSRDVVAQVDIHYPADGVDATVTFMKPISEPDLMKILDLIDDELISAADKERGNLRFRVIQGGVNTIELLHQNKPSVDELFSGGLTNG